MEPSQRRSCASDENVLVFGTSVRKFYIIFGIIPFLHPSTSVKRRQSDEHEANRESNEADPEEKLGAGEVLMKRSGAPIQPETFHRSSAFSFPSTILLDFLHYYFSRFSEIFKEFSSGKIIEKIICKVKIYFFMKNDFNLVVKFIMQIAVGGTIIVSANHRLLPIIGDVILLIFYFILI